MQYAREYHFPNPTFFVDDGVDSVRGDSEFTAIRNVFNDSLA